MNVTGITTVIDATGVNLVIVRLPASNWNEEAAKKLGERIHEGLKGTSLENVRLMFLGDNVDLQFVRLGSET